MKKLIIATTLVAAGCKSFYENSGSRTIVGENFAPVEVSDASESFTAKLAYSLTGASVWTARDSVVTIEYLNVYTNTYFGCIGKTVEQKLAVTIDPKMISVE